MELVSNISLTVSKKIDGVTKVFYFEPGISVEIPDEHCANLFIKDVNHRFVFTREEYDKLFKSSRQEIVEDPAIVEEEFVTLAEQDEDEKKIESHIFSKEELAAKPFQYLMKLGKKVGVKVYFGKKKDELIQELFEALKTPPDTK